MGVIAGGAKGPQGSKAINDAPMTMSNPGPEFFLEPRVEG